MGWKYCHQYIDQLCNRKYTIHLLVLHFDKAKRLIGPTWSVPVNIGYCFQLIWIVTANIQRMTFDIWHLNLYYL